MSAYADTSFLGSLYLQDANAPEAAREMARAKLPLFITPLTEVELTNALSLQVFRGELKATEAHAAEGLFQTDVANRVFEVKPLSPAIIEKAPPQRAPPWPSAPRGRLARTARW